MITQKQFKQARDMLKPSLIAAVVTMREKKINLAPVTWHVVSSKYEQPWVVCIGLSNTSYSLATLQHTKEFVLAFPSQKQIEDVLFCGTVSGRAIDKTVNTGLKFIPSQEINPPCLKNAVLNLECKVLRSVRLKTFTIILGTIVSVRTSSQNAFKKIYALGNEHYGIVTGAKVLQRGRK